MAQIFNQYSFLISAVFLLLVLAGVVLVSPQRKRAILVLCVGILAVFASWLVIRPASSPYASAAEVKALIGKGKPVLVEFQSPF
jgi:hypothetical protein